MGKIKSRHLFRPALAWVDPTLRGVLHVTLFYDYTYSFRSFYPVRGLGHCLKRIK